MFTSIFKKTHFQPSNIKVKEKGKTSRSSFLLTSNSRDTFSLRRRRPATFHRQRLESIPEETTLKLSQTHIIFKENCSCHQVQTILAIAGVLLVATGIIACVMLPLVIGIPIGISLIPLVIFFILCFFVSRSLHESYHTEPQTKGRQHIRSDVGVPQLFKDWE